MRTKNHATDNRINVADLQEEFREFPSTLYSYLEDKTRAESLYDVMKSQYEEMRAQVYVEIKNSGEKVTENAVDARIEIDSRVKEAKYRMFEAKRDAETIKNYVESLRAKKDCLIQLGADSRKER